MPKYFRPKRKAQRPEPYPEIDIESDAETDEESPTDERQPTETQTNSESRNKDRGDSSPDARSRNWFITWNNHDEASIDVLLAISGLKRYAIQEEEGEEGTPHLQGVLIFSSQKKWSTLRNHAQIYWKPARNLMAAKNYCTKIDSRAGKTWIKGFNVMTKIVDPLDKKELRAFQKTIVDLIHEEPDDRSISWFYDIHGGIGKSALCKHLVLEHDAIVVAGSAQHAQYAIAQRIKTKKSVEIVILDYPRSTDAKYVSYIAMEGIKNGLFFCTKYESDMCVFNSPHVLVFANRSPQMDKLTKNRWKIFEILKSGKLKKHVEAEYNFGYK